MLLRVIVLVGGMMMSSLIGAKELTVTFELPAFETAEYHKPYVAIWTESESGNQSLLLWHLKKSQTDKWLVDIRRWWRKLGRYDQTPDAITGATKGPGQYKEVLDVGELEQFTLFIEVVREDGGRSLLKQKIDLNDSESHHQLERGDEIGTVTISIGN